MKDLPAEMAELYKVTQETRLAFLNAEVRTCYSALDQGQTEMKLGRTQIAAQEAKEVAKGIDTLTRFLPQLDNAAHRGVIQVQIDNLRQSLQRFMTTLASQRNSK